MDNQKMMQHSQLARKLCLPKHFPLILSMVFLTWIFSTNAAENSVLLNQDTSKENERIQAQSIVLGAQRFDQYLPLLEGKNVGLVVNQTSSVNQTHLLDLLLGHGVDIKVLFAPEHGVRGNKGAGEHIDSGKDAATGIAIQSIYGKHKIPPDDIMQELDVIVFDIQDVGTRFYTYISSMHYMMAAAAKFDVSFIVLDRPNPNGEFVAGPVLDLAFQSFVGMHPIPLLHGLTVAELAQMIKGEQWIEKAEALDLHLIPMLNYNKSKRYELPIAPSPNLPNFNAVRLYPSLCLFEPTAVSVGRGTDYPFQVIGHDKINLGDFHFTPESRPYSAPSPKLQDSVLSGRKLESTSINGLDLSLLFEAFALFEAQQEPFFKSPDFFDKLAGTDRLRKDMQAGKSLKEIELGWQQALSSYKDLRKPYLLYSSE